MKSVLRSWHGVFITTTLLTFAAVVAAEKFNNPPRPTKIDLEMDVDRGSTVRMYINGHDTVPLPLAIVRGQKHLYTFEGFYSHISRLRLDPTDVALATARIYSITIETKNGSIHRIGPAEIHGWVTNAIGEKVLERDYLKIVTASSGPILDSPQDI